MSAVVDNSAEREIRQQQVRGLGTGILKANFPARHTHTLRPDVVQPWLHGCWRHPFMREHSRYVDIGSGPDRAAGSDAVVNAAA